MIISTRSRSIRKLVTATASLLLAAASPVLAQKGGGKSKPAAPHTISFLSINTAQNAQINLVREDGSGSIAVNNGSGLWRDAWPRWSPDGTMLGGYYKWLNDDLAVMAMNSDGSQERVVVTESEFNAWNLSRQGVLASSLLTSQNYPCWLGNGAMVFAGKTAYDPSFFGESEPSYRSAGERLFVVDAAGHIGPLTETALQNAGPNANGNYYDADPHWSPVLDAVVFISNRSGFDELYAIAPDGTGLTRITDFGIRFNATESEALFTPVWNPQGDRIALAVNFSTFGNPHDLLILDVDLTQPAPGTGPGGRLTGVEFFKISPNRQVLTPSWSPTGDRLLFTSFYNDGSRLSRIVMADVATGAETVLVEAKRKEGTLAPLVRSPDCSPVP